ncbi:hypothetical protein ACFL5Q_04520 [Planctomycetota bacterium]
MIADTCPTDDYEPEDDDEREYFLTRKAECAADYALIFERTRSLLRRGHPVFWKVRDEFAVAAEGLAEWHSAEGKPHDRYTVATSMHELAFTLAEDWVNEVSAVVGDEKHGVSLSHDEKQKLASDVTQADVESGGAAVLDAVLAASPPAGRVFSQFLVRLEQELARAVDRRLVTRRHYPEDDEPYSPVSPNPRSTSSLIPENPEVLQLAKRIRRELPGGGTMINIARDFADGDETKANSLLRQLRRYPHLLE